MKRLLYVLMIVTVLLAGCASGGEKEFSLSPEELGQTIFEKAEFTDQLTLLPKESLYRLYDLDSSLVELRSESWPPCVQLAGWTPPPRRSRSSG